MAIDIFWDSDFKIKSLFPKFSDENGLNSPASLTAATPQDLEVADSYKAVVLIPSTATTITLATTDSGGSPVPGSVDIPLQAGERLTFPLEGVSILTVTSSVTGDLSYYFLVG